MLNKSSSIRTATFFQSNYSTEEELVLTVTLMLTMLFALYGNICMLIIFFKNDKMWNSTYMLIGNLVFSGLLVTLFCMPFSLISVMYGEWPFGENSICQFNAFMESYLFLATILTHTAISIDKYFGVVKPFSRFMTPCRTRVIISTVWLITTLMSIGPLYGFGNFVYNPTTLICGVGFPKERLESLYLLLLSLVGFISPIAIMTFVYLRVFFTVRQHSKRLQETCSCSLETINLQKRLILTSFFSVLCFVLCWTPFFIFVLLATVLESVDEIPYGLGVASYWCGYIYNAINPVIICIMSARFGEKIPQITSDFLRFPFTFSRYLLLLCYEICDRRKSEIDDATQQRQNVEIFTIKSSK